MATKQEVDLDKSPIDEERLSVYPADDSESAIAQLGVSPAVYRAAHAGSELKRIEVEVEFRAVAFGLDEDSFFGYIESFRFAEMTQEAVAKRIRNDLRNALEVADVFVEVQSLSASKTTRIGKVQT